MEITGSHSHHGEIDVNNAICSLAHALPECLNRLLANVRPAKDSPMAVLGSTLKAAFVKARQPACMPPDPSV